MRKLLITLFIFWMPLAACSDSNVSSITKSISKKNNVPVGAYKQNPNADTASSGEGDDPTQSGEAQGAILSPVGSSPTSGGSSTSTPVVPPVSSSGTPSSSSTPTDVSSLTPPVTPSSPPVTPPATPPAAPEATRLVLRDQTMHLILPPGYELATEVHLVDISQSKKPLLIVHYPDASVLPASRNATCLSIATSGTPAERKKCVEAIVMNDAVSTLSETLRNLTCVRNSTGQCRQTTETPAAGCSAYSDEPCWTSDDSGRQSNIEIHLGRTPLVNEILALNPALNSTDEEGSVVYALKDNVGHEKVIITSPSAYGIMFGVAGFLRNWGGVRWAFPGEPGQSLNPPAERWQWDRNELTLRNLQWYDEPDFKGRQLFGIGAHPAWGLETMKVMRSWLLRNRVHPDFSMPYIDALEHRPALVTSEARDDVGHMMNSYIDPSIYGNRGDSANYHPEWYPHLNWYPYFGNAIVSIHQFLTTAGRTYPSDTPLSCAGGNCSWHRDDIPAPAAGPDTALKLFSGSSTMVPYDVPLDSSGIRRYIPGKLPADFHFPLSMSAAETDAGHGRVSAWNSLVPGDAGSWKPCLWEGGAEHPAPRQFLVRQFVHELSNRLASNPLLKSVSLAPNDGSSGYCQCPSCRAKDGEIYYNRSQFNFDPQYDARVGAQHTRRIMEFTKAVAEAAPQLTITSYAYADYFAPPPASSSSSPSEGPFQLPANIRVIMAFPLDESDYDTATSNNNSALKNNVEQWAQAAPAQQLGLYDYMYGLGYFSPHIYLQRIANGMRHAYEHGARIFVAETYSNFSMDAMQLYGVMNLMWDVHQDVNLLKQEFFKAQFQNDSLTATMTRLHQELELEWKRHPNRWHKYPYGGMERFEHLETVDHKVAMSGLPYGMNSSTQFCPYNVSSLAPFDTQLSGEESSICGDPDQFQCRYFRYMNNTYHLFMSLVRLTHARSAADLGTGFSGTTTVRQKILDVITQNQTLIPNIPSFHPSAISYGGGLIQQLDGILANVRASRFPTSYCEWDDARISNDHSRPTP